MAYCISVNERADAFVAEPGESILEAGRRAGFTFPQACRNGNCFRCEGRLLRGEVEHQRSHEKTHATRDPATVLPCIVEARSDCTIAVEGVYGPGELPVAEVAAQVVAIEPLNHNVSRIRLRLPAGKKVERLAGQYLEILDPDGVDGGAYAFSIASPPESGREIELHIRYGDENPSSLAVMALLRREKVVTLRLPMGDCTLAGEPRLPLLFIAGATGFSQVKAFVEHAIARGWTVPVTVCWGARTPEDIYLAELPARWARECANIRFVPVATSLAGSGPGQQEIRSGLVHEAALEQVADFGNVLVYACGSPPMAYAALDAFVARGLPRDRLFSDVFAWAPREEAPG